MPVTDDQTFQQAAKSASKLFMMGMSPLQFKHIDGGQNWYLRGEQNLEYRFGQVLSLQPDMLEIQTWNDAGESHYVGNSWPEPIAGTPILDYTSNYDHKGYWQILASFIQAWKRGDTTTSNIVPTNGAVAQGTFWHHTQLVNANCAPDSLGLGEPSGYQNAEDLVTVRHSTFTIISLLSSVNSNIGCCVSYERPDWSHRHSHKWKHTVRPGEFGRGIQQIQLQWFDYGFRERESPAGD